MSSNHTILDRELFTQALRQMSEEDLRYLNHMVVEQLRHLAQAKNNRNPPVNTVLHYQRY